MRTINFFTVGPMALAAVVTLTTAPAFGAMFVAGADPTTTFSDLLLDDVTPGTGGDTATAVAFTPARTIDSPVGMGPVDISITGIGLNPRGGTAETEETVTITVTYFGADDAFGTLDDVVLGAETATLQYGGAVDEYTAIFDNPIAGQIDGENNRFRFALESTGDMRFKSWSPAQSPSGQNGLKLSVGGTATAVVPEPSSLAIVCLLMAAGGPAATMRRRLG